MILESSNDFVFLAPQLSCAHSILKAELDKYRITNYKA